MKAPMMSSSNDEKLNLTLTECKEENGVKQEKACYYLKITVTEATLHWLSSTASFLQTASLYTASVQLVCKYQINACFYSIPSLDMLLNECSHCKAQKLWEHTITIITFFVPDNICMAHTDGKWMPSRSNV